LAVAVSQVGIEPVVPADAVKQMVAAEFETPPSPVVGSVSVTRESLFNVVAPGLKETGLSDPGGGTVTVYAATATVESLKFGAEHKARIVSAIVTWIGPLYTWLRTNGSDDGIVPSVE